MEDTESPVDSKRPYAPLGTRLFQRRVQIRMAASLLAERLDCSKSCVQHAEQGRRLPSDDLLARWAEALGIGADVQPLLALQREVARRATEAGRRIAVALGLEPQVLLAARAQDAALSARWIQTQDRTGEERLEPRRAQARVVTDAAPMLLSLDPGLPDCGAALFEKGRLVRAAWCRMPPPPDTLAARASALVDLLDQVERDLLGGKLELLQGGVLVAEWPRIYRPERAVKGRAYDPAPLLWLAGVCGALADRCASVGARLDLYQAPEWKGQMDKEAHQRIALHTLIKEEQALLPQMPIARRPESDALDAALLGAWWLRRAGFRRWAS